MGVIKNQLVITCKEPSNRIQKNQVMYFSINTGELLQRVVGNDNGVTAFAYNQNYISTASCNIIFVYNAKGIQQNKFKVHDEFIQCLAVSDTQIISGTDAGSVNIWDIITGKNSI